MRSEGIRLYRAQPKEGFEPRPPLSSGSNREGEQLYIHVLELDSLVCMRAAVGAGGKLTPLRGCRTNRLLTAVSRPV
jgi:hypothetical protein